MTQQQQPAANVNGNAMSQLQPSQVRTLREGFQILDRNSDGVVTSEDVADMLEQLGKRNTLFAHFSASPSPEEAYKWG